jgi:hypothetical protein
MSHRKDRERAKRGLLWRNGRLQDTVAEAEIKKAQVRRVPRGALRTVLLQAATIEEALRMSGARKLSNSFPNVRVENKEANEKGD